MWSEPITLIRKPSNAQAQWCTGSLGFKKTGIYLCQPLVRCCFRLNGGCTHPSVYPSIHPSLVGRSLLSPSMHVVRDDVSPGQVASDSEGYSTDRKNLSCGCREFRHLLCHWPGRLKKNLCRNLDDPRNHFKTGRSEHVTNSTFNIHSLHKASVVFVG